jgi:hypothetical protein
MPCGQAPKAEAPVAAPKDSKGKLTDLSKFKDVYNGKDGQKAPATPAK